MTIRRNLFRFGVCCVFTLSSASGGSVSQNNTYLQNPNFPSVYTATSGISYTVNKVNAGSDTFNIFGLKMITI
jgi:hypothetical protein